MWITLRRSLAHRKAIKCSVQAGHRSWSPLRWFSVSCGTNQTDRPHVGIVGSGPAGFYTAQQILKVCICIYQDNLLAAIPSPPAPSPVCIFWEGWVKKPSKPRSKGDIKIYGTRAWGEMREVGKYYATLHHFIL